MTPEINKQPNTLPISPIEQAYNQFLSGQPAEEFESTYNRVAYHTIAEAGRVAVESWNSMKQGIANRRAEKAYDQVISTTPGSPEADATAEKVSKSIDRQEKIDKIHMKAGKVALKLTGFGEPIISESKREDKRIKKITGPARNDISEVGHRNATFDKHDKRWYQRKGSEGKDKDSQRWYKLTAPGGVDKRGKIAAFRRPWKVAKAERKDIVEANKTLPSAEQTKAPTRRSAAWKATKETKEEFPAHVTAKWAPNTFLRHNKQTGRVASLREELVKLQARERSGKLVWKDGGHDPKGFVHNPKIEQTREELKTAIREELKESRLHKVGRKVGVYGSYDELVDREVERQVALAKHETRSVSESEKKTKRDLKTWRPIYKPSGEVKLRRVLPDRRKYAKLEARYLPRTGMTEADARSMSVSRLEQHLRQESLKDRARREEKDRVRQARFQRHIRANLLRTIRANRARGATEGSAEADTTTTSTTTVDQPKPHTRRSRRGRGQNGGDE